MSSLAQLTSEILHGVGQPNNHTLRERVRNAIIHTCNDHYILCIWFCR